MTSSARRMSCGDGFQNRDPGHSPAFYNTIHYVLYVSVFVVSPPMAGCTSTYGRPHGGPQQVTQGLGLGRGLGPRARCRHLEPDSRFTKVNCVPKLLWPDCRSQHLRFVRVAAPPAYDWALNLGHRLGIVSSVSVQSALRRARSLSCGARSANNDPLTNGGTFSLRGAAVGKPPAQAR